MRISEKMGLVYTALFLTVSVAVITQNKETLMAAFRGEAAYQAVDDIFTVQAGRNQRLFVLENDFNARKVQSTSMRLVSKPGCGQLEQFGGSYVYSLSKSCTGTQHFSYCLNTGKHCEIARVVLRVVTVREAIDSVAVGPTTSLSGFDAQIDMNRSDLEITNVHLGRTAKVESTKKSSSGSKLSRVALERNTAFTRSEQIPSKLNVAGTFNIAPAGEFKSGLSDPVNVAALSPASPTMTDESRPLEMSGIILPKEPGPKPHGVTNALSISALSARLARIDLGHKTPAMTNDYDLSPFGTACESNLSANPEKYGLVRLRLSAPCHPNSRVEVRHGKLVFAVQTSHSGALDLTIPAFETKARFSVRFNDETVLKTSVVVSGLEKTERVALLWTGKHHLQLHALEFDAQIGGSGHVWIGHPRSAEQSALYGGGFTVRLGDPSLENPVLAEIYTLNFERATDSSKVDLLVSATGTGESCGSSASLRTLSSKGGSLMGASGVQFQLPDCGSRTQSIVLKNALHDMIIAGN